MGHVYKAGFLSLVCVLWTVTSLAGTLDLVPAGAQWRYQDSGADLGTGWRQPAYDDASWLSGPAQLGYGDGDEATLLRSSPVYPCYYFRHSFVVTDPAQFDALSLEILRDDGAVVYLNGTEVARYNMPAGTVTFNTWASTASEYSWDPPQSVPNLLVAGINVIAVEVHQANATSTDVSLDLKLTATRTIKVALNTPAPDAIGVPVAPALGATATHPAGSNVTVNFYGRPVTPSGPDFTVVVLPDIQNYTAEINGGSKAILQSQTDWIRANREAWNIVYVAQEGDLSQNGDNDLDQSEWGNASSALYSLENSLTGFGEGIPYGVAVGNHDQIVPAGDTQPTTSYNQYFGLPHFTGKSYYGGSYSTANNNNYYQLFSASGLDFLVVYFEYAATPNQAVLDWANSLLQTHPNRRAIVVTHYLLETTAAWGTQGLAIYNALKANPNLFLMLCGHNHGEAQRTDVYAGNTVYTLLADYQSYAYGGSGYLRLLEFSPANNQIRVKTFSPWLNQFETDANSQFTLNYSLSSGPAFAQIQENSGVLSGTPTTAIWNGLQPATQYEWYVSASDGLDTQASEVRRFTTATTGTPPDAPSNLVATPQSDTEMLLTWTDNSANESGFEVYQSTNTNDFTLVGTTQPDITAVTVTGLQPSTPYTFRVRAISVFGPSTNYIEASASTPAPPPAPLVPSGLTAVPLSPTQIQLAWTDNSDNETSFQLERSLDNVTWTALPMLAADITTTIDEGLTAGTIYYYRVRAWQGSSASGPSDLAAAAPFIDAYASGETLVAGTLSGSIANTLANDGSYEQITEKLSGGKPNSRCSTLEHQWAFQVTPGRSVVFLLQAHQSSSTDGDRFAFAYSTDNVNYQPLGIVQATVDNNLYQSFALPVALQGVVYVRVQDTDRTVGNVALDSLYVDHMLIRTDVSPVLGPPAAPQLQTVAGGDAAVTLTWSPSSGAASYNVYRQTSPEAGFVQIASGVTATTYTDSGLVNETTYTYRVTAVNSFGESAPSNPLSATSQAPLATDAPTSLTAVAGKRKISLTWIQSGSPGVTRNRIYRSAPGGGAYALLADLPASTAYADAVPSGTTYFYVVTAVANGLESSYSPSASATAK